MSSKHTIPTNKLRERRISINKSTQEHDWKYMNGVKDDLLAELCRRTNEKSITILKASGKSEHKKYIELYRHIKNSDEIVARCFNDWRRSTLLMRLIALHRHGLLRVEDLEQLSEQTRETIQALDKP